MCTDVAPIRYHPIGVIHSPFTDPVDMPIQPVGAHGIGGWVEVNPELEPALDGLSGFSHIVLLYHFHRAGVPRLSVTPFLDSEPHGVFATRAPSRPNPIGISVVRLVRIAGCILTIENVDILDGTPLLDIKPYVPAFDHHRAERSGWLERVQGEASRTRSDERFV